MQHAQTPTSTSFCGPLSKKEKKKRTPQMSDEISSRANVKVALWLYVVLSALC